MSDITADNPSEVPKSRELICGSCGRKFLFRRDEQERYAIRGRALPRNCMECSEAARERRDRERERRENQRWQKKREKEKEAFQERLKAWKIVSKDDIVPDNDQVLYILGNGFDLMHGVRSSYYAFRDSLGKNSGLRQALENFWTSSDIWADFESALADFDMQAMGSEYMVDHWLDIFDAYNEDAGAAEFFMAAEAAANPILTVSNELPRRFRRWVESLTIGTEDRPLRSMFRNGKVLCFNYTEFVETLYGVEESHVCYIHGCRRKKKYHPKEELILGHMPGASDHSYDFEDDSLRTVRDPYKSYLLDAAQDQAFHLAIESDEGLTKNCSEIILRHKDFFTGLAGIQNIIVVGHSLSPVDWDYFTEVVSGLADSKEAHWFFGCHGLHDLENLERLLEKIGIARSSVSVFRTDDITVTPIKNRNRSPVVTAGAKDKTRSISSPDRQWSAKMTGRVLRILNQKNGEIDYEVLVSSPISNTFFTSSGQCLFAIICGVDAGILLFRLKDDHWCFVDELESIPYQNLINPRLRHVFLTGRTIRFIYNNRVRIYDLIDGTLISNRGVQGAGNGSYEGEDVSRFFLQKRQR